jgi:hypothetical protein
MTLSTSSLGGKTDEPIAFDPVYDDPAIGCGVVFMLGGVFLASQVSQRAFAS